MGHWEHLTISLQAKMCEVMSRSPHRGRGHRNWEDSNELYSLPKHILDASAFREQVDPRPRITLRFRLQIDERQLDTWHYLDFLQMVYEVPLEVRRRRGDWVYITIRNTTLRSTIGVHVATWLYNMPEATQL